MKTLLHLTVVDRGSGEEMIHWLVDSLKTFTWSKSAKDMLMPSDINSKVNGNHDITTQKTIEEIFFLHQDMKHGPLEPKASHCTMLTPLI